MTYTPTPGSLVADVCDLLRHHPEIHELSIAEIVRRFPGKAKTSNINPCLASALAHHVLNRLRNDKGDLVYRRGRHFDNRAESRTAVAPPQPPAPEPSAPPPTPRQVTTLAAIETTHGTDGLQPTIVAIAPIEKHGANLGVRASAHKGPPPGQRPKRLPPIDPSTLTVRTHVPLPSPAAATKGRTRYDDAFALLKAEGNSLPYPKAYAGSLMQAARTYCKRHPGVHLLVRADPEDPQRCGVWRVSAAEALKASQDTKRSS